MVLRKGSLVYIDHSQPGMCKECYKFKIRKKKWLENREVGLVALIYTFYLFSHNVISFIQLRIRGMPINWNMNSEKDEISKRRGVEKEFSGKKKFSFRRGAKNG